MRLAIRPAQHIHQLGDLAPLVFLIAGGDRSLDTVSDVIAQVFARTGNSFLESTFLEGTFNLVEALKDPERNAARVFGRTATGLIPGSSALRTVARATDPVQRPHEMTQLSSRITASRALALCRPTCRSKIEGMWR